MAGKKNNFLVLLIILAAAAAAFWYFFYAAGDQAKIILPGIEAPKEGDSAKNPEIKTKEIFKQNGNVYLIDIEYPEIGIEKIDKDIAGIFSEKSSEFEKESQPYPTYREDVLNLLTIRYEASFYKNQAVNYSFSITTDTGGAHPFTDTVTRVYDLHSGEIVTLEQIFKKDCEYLDKIASSAKNTVISKLAASQEEASSSVDTEWVESGAGPSAENYRNFILDKEGIRFIFPPYQVAPYAIGQVEATVPYQDLSDCLRPEFK